MFLRTKIFLQPKKKDVKALAPKTVKDIHGVLHQALEQAVQSGELEKNPSDACKLPKVTKKEVKPLEEAQVITFLSLIEGHLHEYLYKITLFTGLREGEVLGLTWDCVDFKNGDDIKTVQNNLGHATASFTLDVYGHVTEQMKRDSSSRMEGFIQGLSGLR